MAPIVQQISTRWAIHLIHNLLFSTGNYLPWRDNISVPFSLLTGYKCELGSSSWFFPTEKSIHTRCCAIISAFLSLPRISLMTSEHVIYTLTILPSTQYPKVWIIHASALLATLYVTLVYFLGREEVPPRAAWRGWCELCMIWEVRSHFIVEEKPTTYVRLFFVAFFVVSYFSQQQNVRAAGVCIAQRASCHIPNWASSFMGSGWDVHAFLAAFSSGPLLVLYYGHLSARLFR